MGKKDNEQYNRFKEAMISILIGATVAFLTTVIEGLYNFIQANSEYIVAGMSSTAYYLAKMYRV